MADPGPRVINSGININRAGAAGPAGNISTVFPRRNTRSKVINVWVQFDRRVTLDANAITLRLHSVGVVYDGTAYPNGMGTVPANYTVTEESPFFSYKWVVGSFGDSGTVDPAFALEGSLKDGVYDIVVNGVKVHDAADTDKRGVTWVGTFHRLFGDSDGASREDNGALGSQWTARVSSADNLVFRTIFGTSLANEQAGFANDLDFDGSGVINSGDNIEFRTRFNKTLTWTT